MFFYKQHFNKQQQVRNFSRLNKRRSNATNLAEANMLNVSVCEEVSFSYGKHKNQYG